MKKNILYKSLGLYEEKEIDEIKVDNDIEEEDLADYDDQQWSYSFGDEAEWKDTYLDNQQIRVDATLALWNGRHQAYKVFDSLQEAISGCLSGMDDVEIFEDQYGNLKIAGYHHDGCNHYILKKLVNNKPRCLHLTKELNNLLNV